MSERSFGLRSPSSGAAARRRAAVDVRLPPAAVVGSEKLGQLGRRFAGVGQFLSYARLVRCAHESAGKKKGTGGKKIGNAHIFEAAVSRAGAQHRLIDELLGFFGGRSQPVMARLIETGQLTLDDVKEAEQLLRELEKKDGRSR